MAVYRNLSTTRVPASLSISYLIGSPPTGTSMMTLTSCGGFLPIEMASMRMEGSVVLTGTIVIRGLASRIHRTFEGGTKNDGLPGQLRLKTRFALSPGNDSSRKKHSVGPGEGDL